MVNERRAAHRKAIDLGGPEWRFGCVAAKPLGARENDRAEVKEWLPATVPGNVRSDLLALHRIEDPFYGTNNEASQWVDDHDWWYVRALDLKLGDGERAFLCFDGIDYISALYLGGVELGRHEGMFSRQVYEVTQPLNQGASELAVRIWGSASLPQRDLSWWESLWTPVATALQRGEEAFPHRSATLKCQMSFGWDFAPRMRTMGLWEEVTLVVTGSVFIRDVFIKAQAEGEGALVTVEAIIDSDREQAAVTEIEVTAPGSGPKRPQIWESDLSIAVGVQDAHMEFVLPDAYLWNPWDRGEPSLHNLELTIIQGGEALDGVSERFGIRSVEMSACPGKAEEDWPLVINGAREFIRGANWVPMSALPGPLQRGDYERLILLAKEAGINMLRVWGGGLTEKKAFYDLCDEHGILVWQEFPLACLLLGHFPRSQGFRDLLRQEATCIVRQLRSHPSLVLWCGGNEFSYLRNRRLLDTLDELVRAEDGTRPFRWTSPGRGDSHHWLVWHGKAPIREYQREKSRLVSEFGLQSLPSVASMSRFLPKDHLFPPNDTWRYHSAQLEKLQRYMAALSPRSLEEWVEASQRVQAHGLQVAIEHIRRRKYHTSGSLVWQLNDAWPAISWSLIDYYGQPKLAWNRLKVVYNPVLVSLEYPLRSYRAGDVLRARVWAISDLLGTWPDCQLDVYLDGKRVFSRFVSLPSDSSQCVGCFEVSLAEDPRQLTAVLLDGRRVISSNEYDLTYHDPSPTPLLNRIYHKIGQWLLR